MSNKYFNEKQLEQLKKNKYVKNATTKSITYKDSFKILYLEQRSLGFGPTQIFAMAGFNVKALGTSRIKSAGKRWYRQNKRIEGVADTRLTNSGRKPGESKNLSLEEKYENALVKIKNLEYTVELLKKKQN